MERIKCTPKVLDITENTTLQPENYGGWLAVNTGTANVSVDGYTLEPGDGLDFTKLDPHVLWNKQIQIVILATGGKVRITRFIYSEAK